jgi:PAS domain S-box-containing protein
VHAVTPLNRPRGYAIAASALIIATFARMALAPVTGDEFPLITYYIAVLAVAWTATLGPALFTFVSGAVLAKLLFSPDWHDWGDYLRYFIVAGAALVAMRAALSRALRQRAFVTGTMQTALDSIVTIDQHDRILEFNPAAERTFGFRRGDVIGRELGGLIIPERYRERHRVALKRYLETGEKTILDRRLELAALRADGAEIPIELAVTQVSTKPPAFTAYIRDLTEKRAAEHALRESEQRFRGLIEQVPDYAIFFTDRDGLATSWNEGVRRVLGFVQEEFIGCDITKAIFTPEDVRAGVPLHELETAAREGTASNDRWMMRKGGKRFFALGVTVARRNAQGELEGFAKIMRDRTDMKKLEDDLNATVESLEGINERQAQFLAMLSHELRNPLAPIRTAVEVLKITRGQGGEAAQAIDVLSRQVTQLVRLVDDLLDLNRIRTGKIQLAKERVDLRAALAHAVEIAQAQCVHYQHHLDVSQPDDPVYIEGDPARIGQVVSNLLHNACKFTPTGGRVELTLAREEGDAVIRVRHARRRGSGSD